MTPVLSLSWPLRLALAVVGGLCLWAAFPPVGVGWLAVVGIALMSLSSWSSRLSLALLAGFLAGLAFFVPLLAWMTIVGNDAWIALGAFCAAWFALMQGGFALVSRLRLAPIWIAAVWVAQEALRGRIPWGGFPWGDLGFAAPSTAWAHALSWVGTAGTAFLLALMGALIAQSVVQRLTRPRVRRWWLPACVAAGVALGLWWVPLARDPGVVDRTAPIAVVQGGTPQLGMGAMDVRRVVLDNHVRWTLDLAQKVADGTVEQPEVVVWPENSTDIDPFQDASVAEAITAAARAVDAPILVGAVIDAEGADGVWNVGVLWPPSGIPQQMYIKNHPVPFGEFVPFREQIAPLIGRFDRVPRDFIAGDRPGLMSVDGFTLGDVICFEIAYSDVVDAAVRGGAQAIAVQTNNATYGGTAQPQQQLQISRARAIEQGRTVVVAATTGISGLIEPTGDIVEELPEDEVGWIVHSVPLRSALTPATVVGRWLEVGFVAIAVVALIAAIVIRTRQRRHTPTSLDGESLSLD